MSPTQLSFSLRVSSGVKTVHLVGSWDNYAGQLPLSKDKHSSKPGSWKGTFRFQTSTLVPGSRYWYYYIIDGYHCAHNPSVESTTEPTTGRELNILDAPKSSSSSTSSSRKSSSKSSSKTSSKSSRASLALEIPKGRPLSISQIKAPKPVSPRGDKHILNSNFDSEDLEQLTARFGATDLDSEDIITGFSASPVSSVGSDLSYRSDSSSPSSTSSGYSTPGSECSSCSCERYGITRKGDRVRLDCGGSRCGYDDESCASDSEDSEDEEEEYEPVRTSRRNGIVVA